MSAQRVLRKKDAETEWKLEQDNKCVFDQVVSGVCLVTQPLECPFSAVSKAIFASKHSFCTNH
jgi:hypothetical protein